MQTISHEAQPEFHPLPSPDSSAVTPVRTLVVDDNRFDRRRVIHTARRAGLGLEFEEAGTRGQARTLIESAPFDLFIIDYRLPDGTGRELVDDIRSSAINTSAPIIMIAGDGRTDLAVDAMRAGCNDYLVKDNIEPKDLCRAVVEALERGRHNLALTETTADKHVFAMVLRQFTDDCISEMRPAIVSMLRQTRDLRSMIEERGQSEADRTLRRIDSSCELLMEFLDEIERYAEQSGAINARARD